MLDWLVALAELVGSIAHASDRYERSRMSRSAGSAGDDRHASVWTGYARSRGLAADAGAWRMEGSHDGTAILIEFPPTDLAPSTASVSTAARVEAARTFRIRRSSSLGRLFSGEQEGLDPPWEAEGSPSFPACEVLRELMGKEIESSCLVELVCEQDRIVMTVDIGPFDFEVVDAAIRTVVAMGRRVSKAPAYR